jgi:hypothetical protein
VTSEPRAFLALDKGAATVAAALIGRVAGRWRLVGSIAMPADAQLEAVISVLGDRVLEAEPEFAAGLGLRPGSVLELPRLEVASQGPGRLAVVAASARGLAPLVASASRSGWRTSSGSADAIDPLAMSMLLLDPGVSAILVGAADPPGVDERRGIGELAALVAAVAERRPDLTIILAGAMTDHLSAFRDADRRSGEIVLAPAAQRDMPGGPLADLLLELALPAGDSHRSLGPAAATLAEVLDRQVDIVEIGFDAGTRVSARPNSGGGPPAFDLAVVPAAALSHAEPDDAMVDRVGSWSTWGADRHRLRDRLRELDVAPWSDAAGEGSALRMAAARAALARLAERTSDWDHRPPADLVVAAGGAWAVASAPAVALAIADVLRRPGASQYALDHARLLAPLGSIPDPGERRAMITDLLDDLLVPLGTFVTPAGLRSGRSAGSMVVHGSDGDTEHDLQPGGLTRVRLAPGVEAVAEFRFRDTVKLGARGRHFAVDVAGGLGGLIVDLRDVPLNLPERADLRGELLESWEQELLHGPEA